MPQKFDPQNHRCWWFEAFFGKQKYPCNLTTYSNDTMKKGTVSPRVVLIFIKKYTTT